MRALSGAMMSLSENPSGFRGGQVNLAPRAMLCTACKQENSTSRNSNNQWNNFIAGSRWSRKRPLLRRMSPHHLLSSRPGHPATLMRIVAPAVPSFPSYILGIRAWCVAHPLFRGRMAKLDPPSCLADVARPSEGPCPFLVRCRRMPLSCSSRFSFVRTLPGTYLLSLCPGERRDALFCRVLSEPAVTSSRDSKPACLSAFPLPGIPMWLLIQEMAMSWSFLFLRACLFSSLCPTLVVHRCWCWLPSAGPSGSLWGGTACRRSSAWLLARLHFS